ncbi:histidine phosphatase family protein [Mycoplasmatota bacterium]|nr:histidine phosphatase family protein [Mycoplasmatota bacterium]
MKIYLIRHGQTDANKNSIIQGRADNPLNETGRMQAKETAKYLLDQGIDFDYCVSSPLDRAIETAEIIKNTMKLDLKTHIEDDLIERDFGDFDGNQIEEGYFQAVHQGIIPGMETDSQIENRVKTFFNYFFKKCSSKQVLMIAHSHVIKALLVQQLPDFDYDTYLTNCCINILEYDQDIQIIDYNINPLTK